MTFFHIYFVVEIIQIFVNKVKNITFTLKNHLKFQIKNFGEKLIFLKKK